MSKEEDSKINNEVPEADDFDLFDWIISIVIDKFIKRFIMYPLFKKISIFGKAIPIWVFVLVLLLGYDVSFSKESKIKSVYYSVVGVLDTITIQQNPKESSTNTNMKQKNESTNSKFPEKKSNDKLIDKILRIVFFLIVSPSLLFYFLYLIIRGRDNEYIGNGIWTIINMFIFLFFTIIGILMLIL